MSPLSAMRRSAMTRLGYDEKPAERQQRAAVGATRICARDQLGVGGLEAAALRFLERVEERLEPGALRPLLDRMLAFEHLEIFGLPHVEGRDAGGQHAVVEGRVAHRHRTEQRLELHAPGPAAGRL